MSIRLAYIGPNVCPVCLGNNDNHFPAHGTGKRMCAGPYFDDPFLPTDPDGNKCPDCDYSRVLYPHVPLKPGWCISAAAVRPAPAAPDIHDEDTYEHMREAATMEALTGECPITEVTDCKSRDCELHYMSAPLRLAPPEVCPACLSNADHLPLTPGSGCIDAFIGIRELGF